VFAAVAEAVGALFGADGAQQRLVSLALHLRAAQAAIPPELGDLDAELNRGRRRGDRRARRAARDPRRIHPRSLAEAARRLPIPVDLDMRVEGLPEHVEVSAYYVIGEALTNTAKHARASAVTVTVQVVDAILRVAVHDDGAGGPTSPAAPA
jgi:hypothetical protein